MEGSGASAEPSGDYVQQQPPLPSGPPPQQTGSFHQQSQIYASQGFCAFPQQQAWQPDGYVVHHNRDVPPISTLLMREAEAWRALLGLHASTLASARQILRTPEDISSISYDEKKEDSESREAAYCAALTGLASQCDSMVNEVLNLRAFRKARRAVEVQCVSEIVRSHSDEVLAVGKTLAANSALSVASATTELRVAIQSQRNQVSQLRALLEAVRSANTLPLPKGSTLVVGLLKEPDGTPEFKDTAAVMNNIYSNDRELNETSLSDALSRLFLDPRTESEQKSRQFARRSLNRAASDT